MLRQGETQIFQTETKENHVRPKTKRNDLGDFKVPKRNETSIIIQLPTHHIIIAQLLNDYRTVMRLFG